MAARPGEENVAVLFGDIHYFYGSPTQNPPHHRFDKGSYVYLFEDANQGRARVEIANQPGTDDQDAFEGFLDTAHLHYSYKQTCVVTLTVGEVRGHEEWHLPTFDPRNENKYHYKLHSLDIYFWTQKDALLFVNGIRRVLPPAQCEILDEPGPPPVPAPNDQAVSAVVQKLENAAISENKANGGVPSFAPPPVAPPPVSAVSGHSQESSPAFVPMAYNPAAPAAPEQIRSREKTPPPEDGGVNPLHQTLAYDAGTPFSPGLPPPGLGPLSPGLPGQFQPQPGAPSFAGPPRQSIASPGFPPQNFGLPGHPGHPGAPPQHPGLVRAATMPVQGLSSPGLGSPYSPGYPGHETPTPPAANPGLPPPPPGGYSPYNYAASNAAPQGMDYSIHQQLYRPTEGEAAHKYGPKKDTRGKIEENAGKLERGVTGMLKKFEKRFG